MSAKLLILRLLNVLHLVLVFPVVDLLHSLVNRGPNAVVTFILLESWHRLIINYKGIY